MRRPDETSRAAHRPMARVTYRATIAYDGARFAGFSRQKDQRTVEGTLLGALRALMPEITTVACGGRTDKGVHATGQVISFWSRGPLDHDRLFSALDEAAPDALAVRDLRIVPRRFHASFSATARRYSYFHRDEGGADVEALDALLDELVGERCFSAFARDTPAGRSTVRRLHEARARRWGPDTVRFDFRASGFLRRQVRVTVATALREAAAGAPSRRLVELAERGDRRGTAPAIDGGGLFLVGVDYDPAEPRRNDHGRRCSSLEASWAASPKGSTLVTGHDAAFEGPDEPNAVGVEGRHRQG